MSKKVYIATVQILVDAETPDDACDGISGLLFDSEFVLDWGYLRMGGQYLYPTERFIDAQDYEEGDFLC